MEVWLGSGPPDGTPELWTQHWLILASLTDLSLPPSRFGKRVCHLLRPLERCVHECPNAET